MSRELSALANQLAGTAHSKSNPQAFLKNEVLRSYQRFIQVSCPEPFKVRVSDEERAREEANFSRAVLAWVFVTRSVVAPDFTQEIASSPDRVLFRHQYAVTLTKLSDLMLEKLEPEMPRERRIGALETDRVGGHGFRSRMAVTDGPRLNLPQAQTGRDGSSVMVPMTWSAGKMKPKMRNEILPVKRIGE